jgi:hypothetical protein
MPSQVTPASLSVVAFTGGAADKIGNEYETWWTLRRVTQLLRGEIDAMAVEPLGGDGAELWVEFRGVRTYDQVKYRSSGTWTPAHLRSDGVLAKLGPQYAAGSKVLLVLSQPSEELERLIGLANATSTAGDLWDATPNSTNLDLLRDAWKVGDEATWAYLRQTSVRHDGLPHLKEFVELALENLVLGTASGAIGVLRSFLDDHRSAPFTSPIVWAALEVAGIFPRPRLEPGPTIARLSDALARHVRAVRRSTPRGGSIPRREVGQIVEAITSTNAPILLVVGKAGAGKSVVVADVAQELEQAGRHVAALRLDRLEPTTSTASDLGRLLGIERSPVVALSEVSPDGFDGVLVIDQLDAVSNFSGRMPTVYEAVDDVLGQAKLLGNVRVILAVRAIDLAEDPRLRRLAGEDVPTIEVGELDPHDIRAYLTQIGTDPASVDSATLGLLGLPIHLYVFSELGEEMRTAPHRTLTSLYAAFTKSFRDRLERDGYPDEWAEVSRVLVDRMNNDEALTVPASALDHIRPLYVEALISANVLVAEDGRVAVFHEAYFDYLFAKSFNARGDELVDWFANSGQGLFRRSQLRQLLAYVAAEETPAFIAQILAVADSKLRPHLVSIAYTVLAGYSPTPDEWLAVRRLLNPANPFVTRVISLIGSPRWFAAADAAGEIERLLDDPAWSEVTAGLIGRLAGDYPERVLELLRPRLSRGAPWVEAVQNAVDVSQSPVWAQFAIEQMAIGSLDLPDRPFDILQTSLFHRMVAPHPLEALKLLSDALSRDLERTIEAGATALEDALSRRGRHSLDAGQIEQLATAVTPEFIDTMLPLIERIATFRAPDGHVAWRYRVGGRHHDFDDDIYFTFDEALTELTRDDAERALPILERLSRHHVDSLDFLVCRALHEADADIAIDWFLETEDRRSLGWLSDMRWESRRLVESASRACSDDRFTKLEGALLHWSPSHKSRAVDLQWNGMAELELLSALPADRLSPIARRRLAELHRKFPWWVPREPDQMSGGIVQSPIAREAAERMSDAHWIGAIEKYRNHDRTTFRNGEAFGGGEQLADMLGTLAKADPGRFLPLALRLPPSAPGIYTEHIVRSLAGEVDQLVLLPLLQKYRDDHPTESGRAVVSAIDAYARDLSDELFEELLLFAGDDDPTEDLARVATSSGTYFGGDFVTAGINSTRGAVVNTLARVIGADRHRLPAALPTLQRLANDPIIAVRTLATEAALAYASIARDDGLDLIARLLVDDDVLNTSSGLRSLRWAMLWDAERFAPILVRALSSEDAKLAGAHWANCAVNDALGSAPGNVSTLFESARIGVADAIATDPRLGQTLLEELFNDPSPEVRKAAARSMHHLQNVDIDTRDHLVARFVESAAFAETLPDLVDALEGLSGDLPSSTWEVCRRAIERMEASAPAGKTVRPGDLVSVLSRLYRASDEKGREAALDLIDRTVLLQLWRVEEALDEAR